MSSLFSYTNLLGGRMNAIQKAIQDITFKIPKQILRLAFINKGYAVINYPVSVESVIRQVVLNERVLVDCNLVGGIQVEVSMSNLSPKFDDGYRQVYVIPKTKTSGRSITSVLSVGFSGIVGTNVTQNHSSVIREALNVLDGANGPNVNSTADISLIGENTIMVEGTTRLNNQTILRCLISNDDEMQNLNPKTIPAFCKLVELAVKSYIFNNTIVDMDVAQLHGGQSLGRVRDIIDGYADAEELYQEYLTTRWKKIAFMDDNESYSRMIRLTTNAGS